MRASLLAAWLFLGCGAVEPLAGGDLGGGAVDAISPGGVADSTSPGGAADSTSRAQSDVRVAVDGLGDAPGPPLDAHEFADDSLPGVDALAADAGDDAAPDLGGGTDPLDPPPTIGAFEELVAAQDGVGIDDFLTAWEMPLCDGLRCLFVTVQDGAGEVLVLGDFNGWEGGEPLAPVPLRPDVWWGIVDMGSPALVEYKLRVDGAWKVDSSNVYFHFGPFGPNSAIYGPGSSRLRLIPGVWSSELANERDLYVYLPAAYFQDETARFPVIYLQDGFNVFTNPAAPFGSWNVDVTADALMADGRVAPAILVGIDTHERLDEYLHAPIDLGEGVASAAKLDSYGAFVVGTVKPLVDSTLRTLPEPAHTGIAGSSLGGLSALYLAVTSPGSFGLCGSFSGSFWVGEKGDAAWAPSLRDVIAQEDPAPGAFRLYMDSGAQTFEGAVTYEADAWVYSDWTRNALIARGWQGRPEWDTDGDLATPPVDLAPGTPPSEVPHLAWGPAVPPGFAAWADWLGTDRDLLSMVGHGHVHNEAAWEKRFGAALTFLLPGPGAL